MDSSTHAPATGSTPRLDGKVAIVTGAGRGIGAGIARRLGSVGATVVVNYGRSEAAAQGVVDEIVTGGGTAIAVRGDVGVGQDVRDLFATTIDRFGRLDIFVSNAGIGTEAPIADMPEEEFGDMIRTNLLGTFIGMQEAARRLSDGGRVITISSGYTRDISPGAGPLAATKAGIEQLSRALALELAPRRITVNTVLPSLIESDGITDEVRAKIAHIIAAVPLGGLGQPSDIGALVAFLASDDARWITGQELLVSGGL